MRGWGEKGNEKGKDVLGDGGGMAQVRDTQSQKVQLVNKRVRTKTQTSGAGKEALVYQRESS